MEICYYDYIPFTKKNEKKNDVILSKKIHGHSVDSFSISRENILTFPIKLKEKNRTDTFSFDSEPNENHIPNKYD